MWPFKKKVVEEPVVPPEPEVIDDWEPRKTSWSRQHTCHCGMVFDRFIGDVACVPSICPQCGCETNKSVSHRVIRHNYEFSKLMKQKHYEFYHLLLMTGRPETLNDRPWVRNWQLEIWTPDHCQHGEKHE